MFTIKLIANIILFILAIAYFAGLIFQKKAKEIDKS